MCAFVRASVPQDRQRIEYVLAKGDEERQEKRQARQGAASASGSGGGGAPQKQLQAFGQVSCRFRDRVHQD